MEEINIYHVRMQKEGQVLGYKSLCIVNLNENQNSKSLESTNWGKEKKIPKCSLFTRVNNRCADELGLQVSSFSIYTSPSSKVTLMSRNHQQAGNTEEGEEELRQQSPEQGRPHYYYFHFFRKSRKIPACL